MKTRTKEYLVLSATLLLCVAAAEAITRVVVPAPLPWLWPQTLFEPSASLGFRLKPNQVSYSVDKPFRTNSMGLRGPERPWKKPAGVQRILILGDSIASGHGVAYGDTFAYKLENVLNDANSRRRYEVINSAVPSFNTLQEVTYFREEGLRLEPDVVILALYWNDISDKSGVTANDEGHLVSESAAKPGWYARWKETKRGYRVRNLLKRSGFLYFIADRVHSLRARFGGKGSRETVIQLAVLTGEPNAAVAAGWAQIDRQLAELAELCAANEIKLLLAILPMPQLLEASYPDAQYPGRVTRMCQTHGLRCVDLLPAFRSQFTGHTSLFVPYDGDHPNERGHRIIAEQLYATLREANLP